MWEGAGKGTRGSWHKDQREQAQGPEGAGTGSSIWRDIFLLGLGAVRGVIKGNLGECMG